MYLDPKPNMSQGSRFQSQLQIEFQTDLGPNQDLNKCVLSHLIYVFYTITKPYVKNATIWAFKQLHIGPIETKPNLTNSQIQIHGLESRSN